MIIGCEWSPTCRCMFLTRTFNYNTIKSTVCTVFPGYVEGLRPRYRHLLQHCGFSHLLRLLCPDRSVCPGQCGHRSTDEAPGGEQQGSQGRGRAGGGDDGTGDGSGGHSSKVAPAQPSDTGYGQVKLWGFPLEVSQRSGYRAGKGWSYGFTHCRYNQRLCRHQSRIPFMHRAPTGGKESCRQTNLFFLSLSLKKS